MQAYEYIWVDFSELEFVEYKLLLEGYGDAGWEMVATAPDLPAGDELAVMLARPLPAPEMRRVA